MKSTETNKTIRVAIFEDNSILREGLYQLVNGTPGFNCVGAYMDCLHLVEYIRQSEPDVVLMDIEMPVMNGIEGVKILKEQFPGIRILMVTVFEDQDKIFNSICAGASGYLLKKTPAVKILEAIQDVYEGGAPMSPSIASKVLTMVKSPHQLRAEEEFNLTEREKEILGYLVKGMSYKMISATCFISVDTVRGHIRNVYEKLHVHSKSEAVIKALTGKII